MIIEYNPPPGVYRNGTRYSSQGRFYDADLWRWFEGTQLPVGGWRLKSSSKVTGKARAILTWVDTENQSWCAVASNTGLFVYSRSGALTTITPMGFIPGPADATTGGGYGYGAYGAGLYGTPRPDNTNVIPALVWTLDTWGSILIACDGREIYEWDPAVGGLATLLSVGSPDPLDAAPSAVAVFVTEEGAITALGAAGDPRKVEWADPEDRHMWRPAATNLAGGFRIQSQGALQSGKRIRGGAVLHTDVDAHLMAYNASSPDVYDIQRLASGCGIVSKQGAAIVDTRDFWMGSNRFWMFNGTVDPLECDVGDFVFQNINPGQISKVSAVHISQFGEVWWLYPSQGSLECDSYVSFNYRENHWNIGKMDRLCGTDKSVFQYPLMVGADGTLYEHEVGQQRDGRSPYALSGPVELGSGEKTLSVYDIIPDEQSLGEVAVSFTTGDWTMSPDDAEGPFALTEETNVRFNTRRVSIKMIAVPDNDFRVGIFRFRVKESSRR